VGFANVAAAARIAAYMILAREMTPVLLALATPYEALGLGDVAAMFDLRS